MKRVEPIPTKWWYPRWMKQRAKEINELAEKHNEVGEQIKSMIEGLSKDGQREVYNSTLRHIETQCYFGGNPEKQREKAIKEFKEEFGWMKNGED